MNLTTTLSIAALMLGFFSTLQASAVNCNSPSPVCVTSYNYDGVSGYVTCTERRAYSGGCTPQYGEYFWYAADCDYPGDLCSTLTVNEEDVEDVSTYIEESQDRACIGTGTYCGWRDGANLTGSSGVDKAARAKLHSCSHSGKSDETYFDTLSECTSNPIGQTKHAKNLACTDSVWDTLCAGWLNTK